MLSRDSLLFWLLLFSAVVSVFLGFVAFDTETAVQLVKHGGYWVMFINVALCLWCGWRVYAERSTGIIRRKRAVLGPLLFVFVVSAVLLAIQPTGYKITMDEPVLSSTAMRMHEYKEVMTTIRGHDIQGVFTQLDGYVDKRPYFYPFLLSLLHDATGYRSGNTFLLNALLTPVFLGLLYFWGHLLWRAWGGYVAILLCATVPLLAMNVNGGGFELLNLVMILTTALAAKLYLDQSTQARMDLLVLLGLLLAQTRYESALYVAAVGAVVIVSWIRSRKRLISPVLIAAPLFLVPFALQQLIFNDYQGLWQIRDDAAHPFMLGFMPSNLLHAGQYFFNVSDDQQPNSLLLSVLAVCSIPCLAVFSWRQLRRSKSWESPLLIAALVFAGIVLANFFLLMAYHWGQLDDIIATRIVLPFIVLQVLWVVFVGGKILRTPSACGLVCLLLVACFALFTVPLCGRSDFLKWVPGQQQAVWFRKLVLANKDQSILYVSNKHVVALVEQVPAIYEVRAIARKQQLDIQLRLGSFKDVLFVYPLKEDPKQPGRFSMESDLETHFDLELVHLEKLGDYRYMCVSRLKAVKWLDSDVRRLELADLATISDAKEKLLYYANTLP